MSEFSNTSYSILSDNESNQSDLLLPSTLPLPPPKRQKKCGGPKSDNVWEYFIKGNEKHDGHYSATCCHCGKKWTRGKPGSLKAHLSNECLNCPEDISKYWRYQLSIESTNYTRRQKDTITFPTHSINLKSFSILVQISLYHQLWLNVWIDQC
jgi:hypothetical protein